MAKEKVSDTKIAIDINGNESNDGGIDFTAGTFATMAGDTGTDANKAPVMYNAKLPAQATALTDVSAVNAVFTVDWNFNGDIASSTPDDAIGDAVFYNPNSDNDGMIAMGNPDFKDSTDGIEILPEVENLPVVEIGDSAFDGFNASTIIIPSTVTTVGNDAFANCDNLDKLVIDNSNGDIDLSNTGVPNNTVIEYRGPAIDNSTTETTPDSWELYYDIEATSFSDYADWGWNKDDFVSQYGVEAFWQVNLKHEFALELAKEDGGAFESWVTGDSLPAIPSISETGGLPLSLNSMFCYINTPSLDLSQWDVSNTVNFSCLFLGNEISELNLTGWDTSSGMFFDRMFSECHNLIELDLSGFDISNTNNLGNMFSGSSKLASLNVSTWDVSNVKCIANTFSKCTALSSLDLSSWDIGNLDDSFSFAYGDYGPFEDCSNLTVAVANSQLANFNALGYASSVVTFVTK